MADDYQYVNSQGLIVPDTSDILIQVQNEWRAAFGQDLVVTPDTPQGLMATAEALARSNVVLNNAAVANQINPNIATGIWLDAIMALLGIQRTPASKTLVPAVSLTGVATTVVPAGTRAKTAAGDLFESLSTVALNGSGSATVDFQSVAFGPIPCAENALNQVVTSILGWETINNVIGGTMGTNTQSDVGARALRNNTLAFQGVALPVAIISALYATDGVKSVFFQENIAATTETINTISMVAHSVYACVYGGTDTDVASALLENKSSGAAWNGSESVTVIEPASGQPYTVLFDRPEEISILIKVIAPTGNSDNIKQAILDYVAGNISGDTGWGIGTDVSPFELAGAISIEYPGTFITSVQVGLAPSGSISTAVIPIAVNQIAVTTLSNITVSSS